MGIIRKVTSMSTAGLVDFRSDKERIARSSRQTASESKKQTKLMQEQFAMQQKMAAQAQRAQQHAQPVPLAAASAVGPVTPAQRIAQLDSMLHQGLITPQEHAQQRQAIISGI